MTNTEPCVELISDGDGVTIRTEVRLEGGDRNLLPKEAAAWYADVIRDARVMMLQRITMHLQEPDRLVRSGWNSWLRPEPLPVLTAPEEPLALNGAEPVEEIEPEVVAAALAAPPPPDPNRLNLPPPPQRGNPEKSKQAKALMAILRKEPNVKFDIPTLKERSHLSDYMVRKTMKELEGVNAVKRHWEGSGGRWGGKEMFSLE